MGVFCRNRRAETPVAARQPAAPRNRGVGGGTAGAPSGLVRTLSKRGAGQTSVEYLLVIAVITVAVVGAAWTYVPAFRTGVERVGFDVRRLLRTGQIERAAPSRQPTFRLNLEQPGRPDSDCGSSFVICPRCTARSCS